MSLQGRYSTVLRIFLTPREPIDTLTTRNRCFLHFSLSHRAVAPQFERKKKIIAASLLAKARFSGTKILRSTFSFPFFAYNEICFFLLERFFSTPIFKSKLLREILPALRVYDPCYVPDSFQAQARTTEIPHSNSANPCTFQFRSTQLYEVNQLTVYALYF